MNNKIINTIAISAICLIISVAIYLSFQSEKHTDMVIDPVLVPVKERLVELQQNTLLTTEEKFVKSYELLENLPPEYNKLKHQYKIAMSTLPDITFYGRVIDQFGQPVSGASIWYEGTNAYLSAGGGRGAVETDEEGFFEIDTVGATLVLGKISHPDVEYAYQQDRINSENSYQDRLKLSKRFLSGVDNNGVYENSNEYTHKDKAYNIHVWRLGEFKGTVEGTLSIYPNLDGRQYTIDLLGNNYKSQIKEGLHEGHFIVSCTRKKMTTLEDYGDWTVNIAPIDGGIQASNDLYMNEAPASGYQSSSTINMKLGNTVYQPFLLNQRYYFTANNGKAFGSLFVHFNPHRRYKRDRCGIEFNSYKINPAGSRNLELKRQPISENEINVFTTYAMWENK